VPRLTREQRRLRRLNQLETAAFWLVVFGGIGLIFLLVGIMS
jgi:hypothetical protein